mgnify:CR=1 FL=1
MWRASRRALVVLGMALVAATAHAADLGTVRVGVLKFGTVNWELDVIKTNGLDRKEGFNLDVQPYGSNDAADVALMGGAVDAIVEDWLFVARHRAEGGDLTFIPYSSSVGALMVGPDSPIASMPPRENEKRIACASSAAKPRIPPSGFRISCATVAAICPIAARRS